MPDDNHRDRATDYTTRPPGGASTDYTTRPPEPPDPYVWGTLELRLGDGVTADSFRHYLHGRAVHCGDLLELRGLDGAPVPVRYEVTISKSFAGPPIRRGKLCTRHGGLEFVRTYVDEYDHCLELRWPRWSGS